MRLLVCLLLCPAALAANSFTCPPDESTGYFADPDQCDKYWDCDRGVANVKYCPDGLAFSNRLRRNANPCVYFWQADCIDKTLQAPNGTAPCERQNGFFPHQDPANCLEYYQCNENQAELVKCPPSLIYNDEKFVCDWPENTNRAGCTVKASVNGFTCPNQVFISSNGLREQHPRFAVDDCRAFIVCLNGVTPQEVNCPLGEVFSETLRSCTLAENVPGCEDYYKDHQFKDLFTDKNNDGRVDKFKQEFRF